MTYYVTMETNNAAGKILLHYLFGLSDLFKRMPVFVVNTYFLTLLQLHFFQGSPESAVFCFYSS